MRKEGLSQVRQLLRVGLVKYGTTEWRRDRRRVRLPRVRNGLAQSKAEYGHRVKEAVSCIAGQDQAKIPRI